MSQQKKIAWDSSEQTIAELEAKLARAYRTVRRLRQENAQLQEEISHLNYPQRRDSLLVRDVADSVPISRQHRYIQSKPRSRRRRLRKKAKSPLRFVALPFLLCWWLLCSAISLFGFVPRTLRQRNKTNRYTYQEKSPQEAKKGLKGQFLAMITVLFIAGWGLMPRANRQQPQPKPSLPAVVSSPLRQASGELVYNLRKTPNFKHTPQLQSVVDQLVHLATQRNLPTKPLSITLINVNSGELGEYQQELPRYPASVVKFFWLVALYGRLEANNLPADEQLRSNLYKMIKHSANDAASRTLDQITGVKSGDKLQGEKLQTWIRKRQQVNQFFAKADYEGIDISHKTYPISYLNYQKPSGRDEQMRRAGGDKVLRNQVTTFHAARLMYEVVTQQALSSQSSRQMAQLLQRDLQEEDPDYGGFNPIRGFFGQSLPEKAILLSKAGWTSRGRHEVAFISSRDGKTAYVLSIFGDDAAYSKDWKIFPRMSNFVYNYMSNPQQLTEIGLLGG